MLKEATIVPVLLALLCDSKRNATAVTGTLAEWGVAHVGEQVNCESLVAKASTKQACPATSMTSGACVISAAYKQTAKGKKKVDRSPNRRGAKRRAPTSKGQACVRSTPVV